MARRPPDDPRGDLRDDPRITDLRRYRKAREQEQRRPPPKPKRPSEGFLGSNPRAGLILAVAAAILAALYLLPVLL